jgi:hypothetical protein
MKHTLQVSFCGMVAALSMAVMVVAGFIPVASYALPALAGVFTIAVVIECNVGWAFSVYGVTAVLSALLLPDKEAALLYCIFLGYYPILKALVERIPNKFAAYCIKFAVFNGAVIGAFFLALWLFTADSDLVAATKSWLPWVLLLLANGVFFVYDFALSGLVITYYRRLHPVISHWMQK